MNCRLAGQQNRTAREETGQSHERNLQMELAPSIGLPAKGGLSSRRDGVKIASGKRSAARGKRVA